MTHVKPHGWAFAVPAALVILLIGAALVRFRPGIDVTVGNTGATPLRDVVLHVTGGSYPLGDLAPGEERKATVQPTSESQLEVELTEVGGGRKRLGAGGYYEPGYRGTIRLSIRDGEIEAQDERVDGW